MIACSTGENLNAMPTCSETVQHFNESLQRCRIYPLSYEVLQRFIEALSNLMRSSLDFSCYHILSTVDSDTVSCKAGASAYILLDQLYLNSWIDCHIYTMLGQQMV